MRTHNSRIVTGGAWPTRCVRHFIVIGLFLSTTAHADDWLDTYYQYRVPFVTRSEDAGLQRLLIHWIVLFIVPKTVPVKPEALYYHVGLW